MPTYIEGTKYWKGVDNMANEQLKTPIEEFQPDPNQPRKYFDETALEELTESVKQYGVLQPIIYYVNETGQKIIVAGERRYQAAKNAGLKEIPAISIDGNEADKVALVENLLREDLTPIEEAEALQNLKDKYKYTNEKLGKALGKATNTITEALTINKLSTQIKEDCKTKPDIPKKTLLQIARMKSEAKQINMYNRVMKYKPADGGTKDAEKEKKDNYKLIMGFVKSLTNKFSKSEILISDDSEKEKIKNELTGLINAANEFMKKYGL
jgi:ParB family chromosome partitioning protein